MNKIARAFGGGIQNRLRQVEEAQLAELYQGGGGGAT